ncbi:MAG: response regulator [Chloroflexota bacterium]
MPGYRVLIVDDQRDVRHMLRAGLATLSAEIQVTDVPSGEEAILVISRHPIDLLISDVRLPGISGLELKERAEVRNPDLKFILMTGLTEPKTRREVANAGADAFFFKPVELSDFLVAVGACLGLETAAPEEIVEEAVEETAEPQGPAVSDDSPQNLSVRLSSLRQQVQATSAMILNDRGQIMVQAGDLPASLNQDILIHSLMATFSAAMKVSYQLGMKSPGDWLYFDGLEYDLFLAHVGPTLGLLLVVPNKALDDQQIWRLLRDMRKAAQELLSILAKVGIPVELEESASLAEEVNALEAVEPVEDLPELDELFSKASKKKLKDKDVDAFWDTLTTDQAEGLTRADAISYDQARQLGLAPDE